MVRLKIYDTGTIYETDGRLTKNIIDRAVDEVRWYRKWFNDEVTHYSHIEIEVNGKLYGLITVHEKFIRYSRVNWHELEWEDVEIRRANNE